MENLWLSLEDNRTRYRPGETLTGRVGWQVETAPRQAELRLFWYTSGIGTRDVGIIETIPFDPPRAQDERSFSLRLPAAPYTFSGRLVSLIWALELVLEPGERTQRVEIEVTPLEVPIVLEKIELPKKEGFRIEYGR